MSCTRYVHEIPDQHGILDAVRGFDARAHVDAERPHGRDGVGDVPGIESAGENGVQMFEDVRDPIGVQQTLYQEMEENENRKFDRVRAPEPQASVADELAKLAALHDQGHLSEAEFAAQKARLLGGRS